MRECELRTVIHQYTAVYFLKPQFTLASISARPSFFSLRVPRSSFFPLRVLFLRMRRIRLEVYDTWPGGTRTGPYDPSRHNE